MANDLGVRGLWAAALLAILALIYAVLGRSGLVPVPRTIGSLATEQRVGHGQAIVVGLYEMQPFVANGNGLPPYALKDKGGSKIRVNPTLSDLKAIPVVVLVDLATGDGTQWNPYVVHTIGSTLLVFGGAAIGALVLCALAFWIAGPLAVAFRRARSRALQRAT